MASWKVTTAPAVEPVTLTEAKLHLRVDHTEDNDYIDELIKAARERVEIDEERSLITQTITMKMDDFPQGDTIDALPRPPLQSVTSIKYQDGDDVQQTLASANYIVDTYSEPARITLAETQSWPSVYGNINDVEIIFVAGWGDAAADVPSTSKQAMLLLIGDMFEHREQQVERVTMTENQAYKSLIAKRKVEQYA